MAIIKIFFGLSWVIQFDCLVYFMNDYTDRFQNDQNDQSKPTVPELLTRYPSMSELHVGCHTPQHASLFHKNPFPTRSWCGDACHTWLQGTRGGGDCHRQLSHGSKLLTKLNFLSGLGVEWPLGLISSGGDEGGGVKGHLIPPQSLAARKSPDSRGIGDGHWLRCANKKKIGLVKCSWIIIQKNPETP